MDVKQTYVSIDEIDSLVEYYTAMKKVEEFNANFGKVKLIEDFIEKLQMLNIEVGVLK